MALYKLNIFLDGEIQMNKAKNYFLFLKRRFVIKKNFLDCSDYLKAGKYKFSESMKYLYIDEHGFESLSHKLFHRKFTNKYITIIRKIMFILFFNNHININQGNKIFEGQIYLPGNVGNCSLLKKAKIFDFSKNQLLEIFDYKEDIERKINDHTYFSKLFNVPSIIEIDYNKNILVEELIQDEKKESDVQKILLSFLEKQTKQINDIPSEMNIVDMEELIIGNKEIFDLIGYNIIENMNRDIKEYKLIECVQHGDLWFENIIISNKMMFLIDYEHTGNYLMYYDFIGFIFREYLLYKRFICLDSFIRGDYDYLLDQIFMNSNCNYLPECKSDYFSIYVLYKNSISNMAKNELKECITVIKYIEEKSA